MEEIKKFVIAGQPCLDEEGCGSSDAMAIYMPEDGDINAHCYSCDKDFYKDSLSSLNLDTEEGVEAILRASKAVKKSSGTTLTVDQIKAIQKRTSIRGGNFRGITDETLDFYKIRTEYNNEGEVVKRYYPNTIGYKPSSFQVRVVKDKIFFFIGKAGSDTDFFGQRFFKDGGKRLLIVGGQEDCAAASQMLWDYRKSKGQTEYGRDAVVSTPSGENCKATVKKQYAWLDKFDEIILGLDNDEAGHKSVESILPHMPKGKVRIANWSEKDPNKMLEMGLGKKFINDYFNAKKHVPIGILDTSTLGDKVRNNIMLPRIPLPPFASELRDLMSGSIPLRKIINIAAETSLGKTTIINELIYFWIFSPKVLPAVVTLELDAAEYAMTLLSRHIGTNLNRFEDQNKALAFINEPWVLEKEHDLYFDEDGNPRWYLVDDRSTTVEAIQEKVEELIVSFGCNVIVLDPLTDLMTGLSNAEQEEFMQWEKNIKKEHDVIFFNVNHVRGSANDGKSGKDTVRFIREDDIHGSTSIPKSADANILISRNKYSDDTMVRNTTEVWLSKCRWTGRTGRAGNWYYDGDTHRLFDLKYYKTHVLGKDGIKTV